MNTLPLSDPPALRLGGWRPWLGLLGRAVLLAAGIGVSLLLAVAALAGAAQAAPAGAAATGAAAPVAAVDAARTPGGPAAAASAPDGAALLFVTDQGPIAAPVQSSRVRLQVTGHAVRARIVQRFANPGDAWRDAIYQFPLPEDAAVDTLRMRIGERTIVGELQPRQQARTTFETARREGRRAALVSSQRPNVFTAEVANIAPGADIEIEIEYQQALGLRDTGWTLRLPTVVAPRYHPPGPAPARDMRPEAVEAGAGEGDGPPAAARRADEAADAGPATGVPPVWARPVALEAPPAPTDGAHDGASASTAPPTPPRAAAHDDDTAPARALEQPPTLLSSDTRANRLSVEVVLEPGVPVTAPESPSHAIRVANAARASSGGEALAHRYTVSFTGEALADRDFVLNWRPRPSAQPAATMYVEAHDGQWYGLLGVAPSVPSQATATRRPREIVFVIDTSGSMHGDSIEQARAALAFGLARLHPDDRFNIIRFSSDHEALFAHSRPADPDNLRRARRFVAGLKADGGTEMRGALERALLPAIPAGWLSQVVFITDGAVSNEAALFEVVENLLGQRRLFTVGIGSSPNSYFMRQAAVHGRGTFTMVDAAHRVEATMARLFTQIGEPVLTGLTLRDAHGEAVQTRDPIRDLYAGDPVLVALRLPERPEGLVLEGEHDGRPWQQTLTVVEQPEAGAHKLWARAELERLGARIRREAGDPGVAEELRARATSLAMTHGLVSAYTSLVAVDHTPVRPPAVDSLRSPVPRHLPAGWDAGRVLGTSQAMMPLAGTATGAWSELLAGLVLLLIAAGFAAVGLCRAQDLFERK